MAVRPNGAFKPDECSVEIDSIIRDMVAKYNLPRWFYYALINRESSFDPKCYNPNGGYGLTQLTGPWYTGKPYPEDLLTPDDNNQAWIDDMGINNFGQWIKMAEVTPLSDAFDPRQNLDRFSSGFAVPFYNRFVLLSITITESLRRLAFAWNKGIFRTFDPNDTSYLALFDKYVNQYRVPCETQDGVWDGKPVLGNLQTLAGLTIPPELDRIWHYEAGQWQLWSRKEAGAFDELTELIPGQEYFCEASDYCELGDLDLSDQPGKFQKINWREPIEFVPGKLITQNWWDFARHALKSLCYVADPWLVKALQSANRPVPSKRTMYDLLHEFNIKKVMIADSFPPGSTGVPGASGAIIIPARTIVFVDKPPLPAFAFPALVLHEACHFYQEDKQIAGTFAWNESMAYSINMMVHWLRGDKIDVFNDPVYPTAVSLKDAALKSP